MAVRHKPSHAPGHEREGRALEDELARDHVRVEPHQRRRDRDGGCQLDQVEGHRGAVALANHDPPAECEAGAEQHAHNRGMEPVEDHVDGVRRQRNGSREHENAADGVSKPSRRDAARLEPRQRERGQGDRRGEADAVRHDRRGGVAVEAQPTVDREPGRLNRTAAEHQHQEAAFADERVAEGVTPFLHGTISTPQRSNRNVLSCPGSWSSI